MNAVISNCGMYRYRLDRTVSDSGQLIINARGKSRFMTLRERIAYWLLKQSTEIQP